MTAVLCLDFEGIVHDGELTSSLIEAFAEPAEVTRLRTLHAAWQITHEEFLIGAFATIEANPGDIHAFVAERMHPAEGLPELADWVHWHGWQLALITTAPDLCVHPALDAVELRRIARHCGRASFSYRWSLRYRSPRGVELRDRFTLAWLSALRETTDLVVYVTSDPTLREASHIAQAVIASPPLHDTLAMEHPRVRPFTSLPGLIQTLEQEGEAWHASCSSTTAAAGW